MSVLIIILKVFFFASLFGVIHTYLIYPLLISIMGWFIRDKETANTRLKSFPKVEIIFAAYNEEAVILEKLKSSFASNYPADRLSVRIGSDASTDQTDAIIRQMQEKETRLFFTRFEERTGKSQILNELIRQSEADLVLFTDANIIFKTDTIEKLVGRMVDPEVGIAGGSIVYKENHARGISQQENSYLRLENRIKNVESLAFGCAMGAEGGCYLIRRELFPGIPRAYFMEDFYITMHVLKSGFRVEMIKDARVFEDVSVESREEYKRKVRISIGNFQNLKTYGGMIVSHFFPIGFVFLSHKVLRWLTPMLLIIMLMSVMFLAPTHAFFALVAGFYMIFIGLALFGILFSQKNKVGWLKYPGHFLYMNLALLEGFYIFIQGVKSNVWQPTKRNQD